MSHGRDGQRSSLLINRGVELHAPLTFSSSTAISFSIPQEIELPHHSCIPQENHLEFTTFLFRKKSIIIDHNNFGIDWMERCKAKLFARVEVYFQIALPVAYFYMPRRSLTKQCPQSLRFCKNSRIYLSIGSKS